MSSFKQRYRARIASTSWRSLRKDILRARGAGCERCGRRNARLCLHHKSYTRFGEELPSDLELLCCECHHGADKRRAYRFSKTVFCAKQLSLPL